MKLIDVVDVSAFWIINKVDDQVPLKQQLHSVFQLQVSLV